MPARHRLVILWLYRSLLGLWLAIGLTGVSLADDSGVTEWKSGTGIWTEGNRWSTGVPDVAKEADVGGESTVMVPKGSYVASLLKVGVRAGDKATVVVDGGQLLLRQDSLRIGEYTGGEGTFVLKEGVVNSVMDIFVGAATGSTGRMNKATLVVQGGTLLGLNLTVGEGLGSDSRVSIEGSRVEAVHMLEFVQLLGTADPSGKPGRSTLSFTLDEHGVTPITIQSRFDGLRIQHDERSRCELEVHLSAVPPREDVGLISSHVRTEGTFDGMPEGHEIAAEFGGRTYRWILTYRGGASGHDLVLLNRSDYAPEGPLTHVRSLPQVPIPLWLAHPVYPLSIPEGEPAFPGAEGYGAYTPGGRGGRTIEVTNLNDGGTGSLRAALSASGPRIVLFRVGGVVILMSKIVITEPYLTVDGTDGPSPGIMLRRHGIEVRTHDIVLRQFRIRIGDDDVRQNDANIRYAAGDGEYGLYFTDGSKNCIADHLSLSWSTNKILSTTLMSDLITVQWCILSESLNLDGHGYASIMGGNRMSWHHNLFAHNYSRNVRFQGAVDADFRNNVVYDWGEKSAYGEFDRLNYVGNYLKPGLSTEQRPLLFHDGTEVVLPGSLFMKDNVLEGRPELTKDNWRGTGFYFSRSTTEAVSPFSAPGVTTEPAPLAFEHVVRGAGATAPVRDAVDSRIATEVTAGTGHIVDNVKAAGGWPDFGTVKGDSSR